MILQKEDFSNRLQQDLQTKNQMVLSLQRTLKEFELRIQQQAENNERLKDIVISTYTSILFIYRAINKANTLNSLKQ